MTGYGRSAAVRPADDGHQLVVAMAIAVESPVPNSVSLSVAVCCPGKFSVVSQMGGIHVRPVASRGSFRQPAPIPKTLGPPPPHQVLNALLKRYLNWM